MPRKRMSLRAIAQMKRENRQLRERLSSLRHDLSYPIYAGTEIARGSVCTEATASLRTAQRLGFLNVVSVEHDGSLNVRAVKPIFTVAGS
jgi:hypothetical protein